MNSSVPDRYLSRQKDDGRLWVVAVRHTAVADRTAVGDRAIHHIVGEADPTAGEEVRILAGVDPHTLVVHSHIQQVVLRSLKQGVD